MSDFLIQIGCACLIFITAALGVWGPLAILTRAYKSDNKCSIAGSTIDLEKPLLVPASTANTMTVIPAAHLPSYGTVDSVINNNHLRNQDTHFAKQHNEELRWEEQQQHHQKEKDNVQHHHPSLEHKAGNQLVALPVTRDFLSPAHSRPDEYAHEESNELEKRHVEVNENNKDKKYDHDNINQFHTTDTLAALPQPAKSTTVTPTHEINEQMPLLLSPSHREYHSLLDNQQTHELSERAKEQKRIRQRRLRRKRLLRRTHPMLSYANYFSAGMLIAMACDHFLPSAFAHASANQTHSVAGWVLMGLLIPAILECSANTEIVSDSNTLGVEDEDKKMIEEKTKPEFYELEEQESISPRRESNNELEEQQEKLQRQKRRWSNHNNWSHEAHGHSHLLIQEETSSDEEEEEEYLYDLDNDEDSATIENNNENIVNENKMTYKSKNNANNGAEGQTWQSQEKLSAFPRSDSPINLTKDKNQTETQELQDKQPLYKKQQQHHVIIHDNDNNTRNILHTTTTTASATSAANREKSASASHHVSFQETLKHMSPKELYKHQVALPSFSTATLLITLMCFHAILEGLLLGIESNSRSLLDVTLPLSLHKFLDGIVIGVSLAKDHQRRVDRWLMACEQVKDEMAKHTGSSVSNMSNTINNNNYNNNNNNDDVSASRSALYYHTHEQYRKLQTVMLKRPKAATIWQAIVFIWLIITPISMLIAVYWFNRPTHSATHNTNAIANDTAHANNAQPPHWWSFLSFSLPTMIIIRAVGTGSFLYIGLTILLHDELRGLLCGAALLWGTLATFSLFRLKSVKMETFYNKL